MSKDTNKPAPKPARKVLVFIGLVTAASVASLPTLPTSGFADSPLTLLLMLTLAALAAYKPIRIAALRTTVSASDPFVFAAIVALGPLPSAAVALTTVVSSAIGMRLRTSPHKLLFNMAAVLLSTIAAAQVYMLAGGGNGGLQHAILPLVAGATAYFLVNTVLVTAVICIDRGAPLFRTWAQSGLWTATTNYAGLTLAVVLLLALDGVGPLGLFLGVPPVWMLLVFYRTHRERVDEERNRMQQVLDANLLLEEKVRERTQELETSNQELISANDQLEDANRAKNLFMANVSHELRTPLNAIIGFSELMKDRSCGDLNGEQTEYVKDIHDSGVHLLHLINDILDLSKIEAGKLELHREVIDLHEAAEETAAMLRPLAQKKSLTLRVSCPSGPMVDVDPGMFRQVMLNLLSNAVKFTPEGGRVELRAKQDDRDLVVEIQDSGIGIPEEHQPRVFDEFYQVDGSFTRLHQGTGLGLALVRRMVELHGGSISVESTPGFGSTFTLTIPECLRIFDRPEPNIELAVEKKLAFDTSGNKVLVVEDNPVNMKLARALLLKRGYDVVHATTGEEALGMVAKELPDLILMDIQLPGIDGLEVTQRIKSHPRTAGIPVIALTAHVQDTERKRARDAGCDGYLTKPIRVDLLDSELRSAFGGSSEIN